MNIADLNVHTLGQFAFKRFMHCKSRIVTMMSVTYIRHFMEQLPYDSR